MKIDYKAICAEHKELYGSDVGEYGRFFHENLYDDRSHFIYELLQNAEDALSRRQGWTGSRTVSFSLTKATLTVSHYGKPFDDGDVRSICSIGKSTKDESSIGRFGIGFKSVYSVTDRPEIHSGKENFTIRNFVQPAIAEKANHAPEETLIILPLNKSDSAIHKEISVGLKGIGIKTLLFLQSIEEIKWEVEGESRGFYLRNPTEIIDEHVKRISLIGHEEGQEEAEQDWLVFDREVISSTDKSAGRISIAFNMDVPDDNPEQWQVVPVSTSPLVAYFPTTLETNLGFLIQGPYRTTTSRDNIQRNDSWNNYLVNETAELLVDALCWMRDNEKLDIGVLRCLPIDRDKFSDESMFKKLFNKVRDALYREPLIPSYGDGFAPASKMRLARTQETRELFTPSQIANIFEDDVSAWVTEEVTPDLSPEIRGYLKEEQDMEELTPDTIIRRLHQEFLESQANSWILRLYEFLNGQEAIVRNAIGNIPILRLTNGGHVPVKVNGQPGAFLPTESTIDFPTIISAVCETDESIQFLKSLGIDEPDPVDDVIRNRLPKYQDNMVPQINEYADDIKRILRAFKTDSEMQRENLINELRETSFVMVIDAGDGSESIDKPRNIYLATDRLKKLFQGVQGIKIVNGDIDCLRGETIRDLLEACGATRYPRPLKVQVRPSDINFVQLRRDAGHEQTSGINDEFKDWTLKEFQKVVEKLPDLGKDGRIERARLLWESLSDIENRRGHTVFDGEYHWSHYGQYSAFFPSAYIRHLNHSKWVPDEQGNLHLPSHVIFDALDWKANPFLQTKILFKSPVIDQLAEEAGIETAVLDLLKKRGLTSIDSLLAELSLEDDQIEGDADRQSSTGDSGNEVENNDDLTDTPDEVSEPRNEGSRNGNTQSKNPNKAGSKRKKGSGNRPDYREGTNGQQGKPSTNNKSTREFISYIAIHKDEEQEDPDGLEHEKRMKLEGRAIDKIIQDEPSLQRTKTGNAGFDLYETDESGKQYRWIEVKSMTGSLDDRPVGMSHVQFEFAREKGDAFWLYIVEYASDPEKTNILKIQNPAKQARYFTFDRGWRDIAETS